MKNKEKEKFLRYCYIFKNDLEDLQKEIDFEHDRNKCTLSFIGANYSYELANTCFELGYYSWFFYHEKDMKYEDLKQNVYETIISDLEITKEYNEEQLTKIKENILNAKSNY